MNDDDLEVQLQRVLNRGVDQKLGPRRQPPVFHPEAGTPRPWLVPLLAAACVLVAVAATFGAEQLVTSHRGGPGASTPPMSAAPSGTPAHSSSPPTAHSTSSHSPESSSPTSLPQSVTMRLGDASLQLPTDWEARPLQEYYSAGGPLDPQSWCLTPKSTPVSTGRYGCPIAFNADLAQVKNAINSDTESGYDSNPEYCFPNQGTGGVGGSTSRTQSEDRRLGNRAADYRRFDISCANGLKFLVEQYVVTTGPAYSMFLEAQVDPASQAAEALTAEIDFIAQHAQLPDETSAVRLYDHGYIRSVTPVADGVQIALDRVVPGPDGPVNNNPQTYNYVVPSSVHLTQPLAVGQLVSVFSDGSQVTSVE